jgi:hypothetical protein
VDHHLWYFVGIQQGDRYKTAGVAGREADDDDMFRSGKVCELRRT